MTGLLAGCITLNACGKEEPTESAEWESMESQTAQDTQTTDENTDAQSGNISGSIESVSDGSFVLSKTETWETEDGAQFAVENLNDKNLVTVLYTDETVFQICTSSDGGITNNYTDASPSDLAADKSVNIDGAYEGESFRASKVIIYNFL